MAPAQGRCLPGVHAPFIEGVGLAIGKHGGVATASGDVLMELALQASLPNGSNVGGQDAGR